MGLKAPDATRRGSGILLHLSSLPSAHGIGDLGPAAREFADFLAEAKQRFWQILPVGPTDQARGNSPYSSTSAFAGNRLLVSPELMAGEGLLTREDLDALPALTPRQVNYPSVVAHREQLFRTAFARFKRAGDKSAYGEFCEANSEWLDEFAAFTAIKAHLGGRAWGQWPAELRLRRRNPLEALRHKLSEQIEMEKFVQHLFFRQWFAFKRYCNDKGIEIVGDLPIYVSDDSADTWSCPEIFKLDDERRPTVVAGVPPDYFSKTGQLWGNPLYRWDVLKANDYGWWVKRAAHALSLFDIVRIDHFRGFAGYWEVPAGEETAVDGRWADAPAEDFFQTLIGHFPDLPLVAEDLGVITPDVRALMRRFGFPGMKVLLFAFGDSDPLNPYLPHNYVPNCFVYTGTHDNNTARGWYDAEARPQEKQNLARYLGSEIRPETLHWDLVRLAMMSVARGAIFPVQDILGFGEEARMNRPSVPDGNWAWRLVPGDLSPKARATLLEMTETYGRATVSQEARAE